MAREPDDETETDIIVTKALRHALRAEITRTGITAIMLLVNARDLPNGLTARTVNRWISGLAKTASQAHLDYAVARWATLPNDPGRQTSDGRTLSKRGARHAGDGETRILVTAEMSAQLRAELIRTGTPPASALRGLDDLPDGLTQRVVYGWLHREIGTADPRHWEFVINHLKALATYSDRAKLRKLKE